MVAGAEPARPRRFDERGRWVPWVGVRWPSRPRELHRRWSEYACARSCIGGARRLAGPPPSRGRSGVESGCASWRTGGRLFTAAGFRAATPALQDGGRRPRRGNDQARAVRRAACAEPICGVRKLAGRGGFTARWSEYACARSLHRAGHGGSQAQNIRRAGGCGNGVGVPGGPEDGRQAGRSSRAATPALQDGGCRPRRGNDRARAVRRAACAEPICGAGGWQGTMASPPDGASTLAHGVCIGRGAAAGRRGREQSGGACGARSAGVKVR